MHFLFPFSSYPLHRFTSSFRATVDAIEFSNQAKSDTEWDVRIRQCNWRAEWAMNALEDLEMDITIGYDKYFTDPFREYASAYLSAFLKYHASIPCVDGVLIRQPEFRFNVSSAK